MKVVLDFLYSVLGTLNGCLFVNRRNPEDELTLRLEGLISYFCFKASNYCPLVRILKGSMYSLCCKEQSCFGLKIRLMGFALVGLLIWIRSGGGCCWWN